MNIDTDALLALPSSDKLRIVELLWDNLCEPNEEMPIPDWVEQEATRRRDEMITHPTLEQTHDQVWMKIAGRNG